MPTQVQAYHMELRGQFIVVKLPVPGEATLTISMDPENRRPGGISVLFHKEPGATGTFDVASIVLGIELHCKPPITHFDESLKEAHLTTVVAIVSLQPVCLNCISKRPISQQSLRLSRYNQYA